MVIWLLLNVLLCADDSRSFAGNGFPTRRILTPAVKTLLCLSYFPIAPTLIQGQDAIVLLLILLIALRLLLRGAGV